MVNINLGDRPRYPFIPVELSKARVDELMQCINDGKPLTPPDGTWSVPELLALAGAAIAVVECHGPISWPTAFTAEERNFDQLPDEERDRQLNRLRSYLGFAVRSYNMLALAALQKHWPNMYEDHVGLVILEDGTVVGVSGVRPQAAG